MPCQWHSEIRRDGNQKALEWGALIHQNSWSLNPIQTIICNERHKSAILGMMVKSGRMRESFVGVFAAVAAKKCSRILLENLTDSLFTEKEKHFETFNNRVPLGARLFSFSMKVSISQSESLNRPHVVVQDC